MKKLTVDNFYECTNENKKADFLFKESYENLTGSWYTQRKPIGFTFPVAESTCSFDVLGTTFILPIKLKDVVNEILDSKYILDLKDDWDGEGSPSFSNELYIDAIQFLYDYALALFNVHKIVIEAPEINPCHDGSIDLSWKNESVRLLINVKSIDGKSKVLYFRDHHNNHQSSRGELTLNCIDESFLIWMKLLKQF